MRRSTRHLRGQQMVEVILLVGLVCLAIAWVTWKTQEAIQKSYDNQQKIIASPL